MHVVAGIEIRAQPLGVCGIARQGVEIDDRIKCPAGPNPLVHGLANRLPVLGVGSHAFDRHDRSACHLDTVHVRSLDHLPVSPNQVFGCDSLARRNSRYCRKRNVVDSFQQNHPMNPGAREYVTVEAGQCIRSGDVVQHPIAGDSQVQHAQHGGGLVGRQSAGQEGGPSLIFVGRGPKAVRNGVPESHDRRSAGRRQRRRRPRARNRRLWL